MRRRHVAPYPTRPTRPLEHSHCRAKSTRTVRVHCEHILMWSECTGRTRRSGRSVYTGNPTRTVRERYARRVKWSVCNAVFTLGPVLFRILANRTRRVDLASGLHSHYKRQTRRERYASTSPCTHCVCFATGCDPITCPQLVAYIAVFGSCINYITC